VKTVDVAASVLALISTGLLTWPALRVGRMLNRAAKMGAGAVRTIDPVSASIFRRLQSAYASDTWRPVDQLLLWLGLIAAALGAVLDIYSKLAAPYTQS
jgi:hypothetical protein